MELYLQNSQGFCKNRWDSSDSGRKRHWKNYSWKSFAFYFQSMQNYLDRCSNQKVIK